jgi:dephospho-CoA kinase
MTKVIGLTGGIGSGKTTVAKLFLAKGIQIYIADDSARLIMKNVEVIAEIQRVFGNTVFDGTDLNRENLANIVFSDPEKLKKLNAIVHPKVKEHFEEWLFRNNNVPFVIYESAILFESGSYKNCDYIITVVAPLETRIQRVMKRDSTSRELVIVRINSQWNDEQRVEKSDFIINNNNIESTDFEVVKILKILNI